MTTSETITKIAPALLKAQKEIGSAKKGSDNPFFKSKYADLGEVISVCKEELNSNGIAVLQTVGVGTLTTTLLHESGEFISETMNIVSKSENNPQDYGSAITYAKRYSLQSMLLIPSEDDDGNKATKVNVKSEVTTTEPTDNLATTSQVWKIESLISPLDVQKVLTKYRVGSLRELTKQQASVVINMAYAKKPVEAETIAQENEVTDTGKTPF